MRRRGRDGAAETSQHPFRALFDLMLALVLAAVVVAQHRVLFPPKHALAPKTVDTASREKSHGTDPAQVLERELLLHKVERRRADPGEAALYEDFADLPPSDECARYHAERTRRTDPGHSATIARTSSGRLQKLEAHRDTLFAHLETVLRDQLLGTRITRVVGQDELRFASESATPTDQSQLPAILALIWRRYQKGYYRIRIEGHTDSVAIQTVLFPSNWELSAARAIFLAKAIERDFERRGVPTGEGGVTVEAIGYGAREPVASNMTEHGRRQNRRIRIVFEK